MSTAEQTMVAAVGAPMGSTSRWRSTFTQLLTEVGLLGLLFVVYRSGRILSAHEVSAAVTHANEVWHVERWLRLPSESAMQAAVLPWQWAVSAFNHYYVTAHFPVTVAMLLWLFIRHRDIYKRARFAVVVGTLTALVVQIVYPLMPPRMMTGFGFVDTMMKYGPSAYGSMDSGLANQLAAMPSLHVGWSVLCVIAAVATRNRFAIVLFSLHSLMTIATVLLTANHYWLDGIIGASLLALAWRLSRVSWRRRPMALAR